MNTSSNTVSAKLSELSAMRAKMDSLTSEVEAERLAVLRGLPASLGYNNAKELIAAIASANRGNKGTKAIRNATKRTSKRKARVSITPEKRSEISGFFKGGGNVVDAVAKFGISIPTAQNIKKEAGMVKARA